MTRIDPHAHTTHSDGTDTPEELIVLAKKAGLDVVGITDHDTTSGWAEAESASQKHGLGLIRGAEISSLGHGYPVHVLALLFDGEDENLQSILSLARESRATRLQKITENLEEDFPRVKWENVFARAAGAPLGRPHLADELVAQGYFSVRDEAFETVLHPHGPYYVRQTSVEPAEAVEAIRKAGGVAIFAHPRATKRGRMIPEVVYEEMVDAGVFALEMDHRDHDEEGRREVARLAKRFNLEVTGGSDYHGSGKPNLLGENLTSPKILDKIEAQAALPVLRP